MKYRKIIISLICLVCIVTFCFIATTGKIYKLDELPLNFMSAFLGAIVTAVITLILLSGQSTAEEIKERNVIVFNKKSVIFEKFINRLYKVLQEQKINASTYMEIKTEFYTELVLYLKKKSQQQITAYLEKLAGCIGVGADKESVIDTMQPSYFMTKLNKKYYYLRENILLIINILINELGLGGEIDIKLQNDLERKDFPYLLYKTLLEEIDNIFTKRDCVFFGNAFFNKCEDGIFITIPIKGRISLGGRIEIGPFPDSTKEGYSQILNFRLLMSTLNSDVKPYASRRKANVEGKYINFYTNELENEYDEYDQINLTETIEEFELEKLGIEKEGIYNKLICQFGFDDEAYNQFSGYYLSICKTIAAQAYYYFLTTKTEKDGIPLKKLCEELA